MEELVKAIQALGNPSQIDYIQLVLTIVSIIISATALFVAIFIPKKIAEEQNKIALFEKRYAFYITFTKSTAFVKVLERLNIQTKEEVLQYFIKFVGEKILDNTSQEIVKSESTLLLHKTIAVLGQAKYIFDLESDELLEKFSYDLIGLLQVKSDEDFLSCFNKLKSSSTNVYTNLDSVFEKQLCLK